MKVNIKLECPHCGGYAYTYVTLPALNFILVSVPCNDCGREVSQTIRNNTRNSRLEETIWDYAVDEPEADDGSDKPITPIRDWEADNFGSLLEILPTAKAIEDL